jgi:hypothetical protein
MNPTAFSTRQIGLYQIYQKKFHRKKVHAMISIPLSQAYLSPDYTRVMLGVPCCFVCAWNLVPHIMGRTQTEGV